MSLPDRKAFPRYDSSSKAVAMAFFLRGLLFFLVAQCSAHAATYPLEELGKLAAKNTSLLRAQRAELDAAKEDAAGSGLLANPQLNAQVGSLKSGASTGLTVEASLSQSIPFPGRLSAQRQVRELESRVREVSLTRATLLVEHEATLLGYRWVELDEETQHFRERQRRFQVIEQFLRTHPQASPSQQVESALLQRQIQLIEREFVSLEEERDTVALQLKYLLASEEPVAVRRRWLSAADIPDKTLLSAEALEQSPDLQLRALEVDHARKELEVAEKKTYPDLNLGLGYRLENVSPSNHFYYGMLSLAVPIFDRGQHSVPAARARRDAKEAAQELRRSQLTLEKETAWARLKAAVAMTQKIPLTTAEETEAQFKKVESEFRKGRITTSLLLQSDAQLHQAVSAAYEAQVNLAKKLSDLYLLYGKSFSWK